MICYKTYFVIFPIIFHGKTPLVVTSSIRTNCLFHNIFLLRHGKIIYSPYFCNQNKKLTTKQMKKLFLFLLLTEVFLYAYAQQRPSRESVLHIAQRVNDYFIKKYSDPTKPTFVKKERPSNLWTRGVYYEGLMALYEVDPQQSYLDYTDKWANFHAWSPRNGIKTVHADDQCCGQTYLMRFLQTGATDQNKIAQVKKNADLQMHGGAVNHWTWIDAIQMAMPVYSKLYKITGDKAYMNYAMKLYRWTRNECGGGLFNEKSGLWYRDADFVPPYKESDGQDCYWSRGDGWVYAALVRVMSDLKRNDKYYKELRKDFLLMSKAIKNCQRSDGFWNVSLLSPITYGGKETTGTSLFLYGMCWGVENGLLKKNEYLPVIHKTWQGLSEYSMHPDGFLGYVQGTGKEPKDGQPLSYTRIPDFEDFGIGCFLLGASQYIKLLSK